MYGPRNVCTVGTFYIPQSPIAATDAIQFLPQLDNLTTGLYLTCCLPLMFDPPHLITTPSISCVTIYIFYCNGQAVIPVCSDGGNGSHWLNSPTQ